MAVGAEQREIMQSRPRALLEPRDWQRVVALGEAFTALAVSRGEVKAACLAGQLSVGGEGCGLLGGDELRAALANDVDACE